MHSLRNEEEGSPTLHEKTKNNEVIFFLAWNIIFSYNWKVLVFKFLEMKKSKKLMRIWYLLITEKFLFWSFWKLEIRSFLEPKNWLKDDIYWLLKRPCFELFGDGKYGLFLSQEVYGKMIFTCSFWAFYDIPEPGKYCFSRSVVISKSKD